MGGEALGWKRTKATDADGRRVWIADSDEIETAERIRELRASGLSLRLICAQLGREGRRTKRGGVWAPQTVAQVLRRGLAPREKVA
jgi:hypothetical protein